MYTCMVRTNHFQIPTASCAFRAHYLLRYSRRLSAVSELRPFGSVDSDDDDGDGESEGVVGGRLSRYRAKSIMGMDWIG